MKILIIEDEQTLRNALEDYLNKKHEIVKAVNGYEGIYKATIEKPDLILVDIIMPQLGGMYVINYVLENKLDIKLVVLTNDQLFELTDNKKKVSKIFNKSNTSLKTIVDFIDTLK